MDSIINGLDINAFLKANTVLICALLALALLSRFLFGKKSILLHSVSSSIGIFFVYCLTLVLCYASAEFQKFIAPLPLVTIQSGTMHLFTFQQDYTIICAEILSMIVLAFLMNLADSWLPVGKHIFTWIIFRCLGVIFASLLHLIATGLLTTYLPGGLVTYAPTIFLGILALMLLTGALKILVGLILTSVNPLIAAFYTFFFANAVGKQVTRAILTTGILTALILILQEMGITVIAITTTALSAYIPLILLLLVLWYIVGKLLQKS